MAKTTGDVIVEKLIDWGVDTAFGLPGDGINGIFEALRKNKEKIRFIQCRHEEGAAFAACGYAKFTGRLGVCFATSGPGAIHLLNGLYDAKLDHAPVLAITGHTYHDQIGTHFQQEIDILQLFSDVAPYNEMIFGPKHAGELVNIACRSALSGRTVSHLTTPADIQDWTASDEQSSPQMVGGHTGSSWRAPITVPQAETLKTAAELINKCKKVVILAGMGALGAGDELERMADIVGGPIIKPLLGKAVVPDDSPFTTGGIGLLGTRPSELAMEECDGLVMVGTTFPYLKWYPKPDQARAVQIDVDPKRIGLRYPVEVGLVGDARATLQELLPLLQPKKDRSFLEKAQKGMKDWWELMRTRESRDDTPVKPQVVARHVNESAQGRRDHLDRLRHDHHLGGPAHPHPPGHAVLVLGQPGHHGAGPALCHRRPGRLPRPAGRRLRRRRRLHDADGRLRHGVSSTSCRSRSSSSRTTCSARSSGSRWSSSAIPSTRSRCTRSTS